ncbi:MAG: hypothetical protein BWK78_02045 [Thiotrichaceae bacterium IS1]|nr:MAG: hypothetical protein BWK78_02045 [Thiotrichaceae bacterium IS1]
MAAFNKYYRSERAFLVEQGKEFAAKNERLAPFLDLQHDPQGNDPDVERLLEGFAFLTGRLREKLEDELPELTHSLIELLWPHYLRPIPALSILEFKPQPQQNVNQGQTVPRAQFLNTRHRPGENEELGCMVDSEKIEGTVCHFGTCYDVEIYPLHLDNLQLSPDGYELTLGFLRDEGTELSQLNIEKLRLYLDDTKVAYTLYLWLFKHLRTLRVQAIGETTTQKFTVTHTVTQPAVSPVGFADHGAELLPYPTNAFAGYRLLQEYFSLPEKFLFVEVNGLTQLNTFVKAKGFKLTFEFAIPLEKIKLSPNNFRLYCTPIVNLFKHSAVPLQLEHYQVEYRVRPEGHSEHYEVYGINQVTGRKTGGAGQRSYPKFETFHHAAEGQLASYYRSRNRVRPRGKKIGEFGEFGEAVEAREDEVPTYYRSQLRSSVSLTEGIDTYISFVTAKEDTRFLSGSETISIELLCSNRYLPHKLKVGQISKSTNTSPDKIAFENIIPVRPSVPPPLKAGLHWRLISNMSLNYLSLTNAEALQEILLSYDFKAHRNDEELAKTRDFLKCIEQVTSSETYLLEEGIPIRGIKTCLDLDEDKFVEGDGELYLFASVLNEFFALYASINSFHQLEVKGIKRGKVYRWPPRRGKQPLNGVTPNDEQSGRRVN